MKGTDNHTLAMDNIPSVYNTIKIIAIRPKACQAIMVNSNIVITERGR